MNPKTILTEDGWDEVAPDCKGKDKELRKAFSFYGSLEDDDFDSRCKALVKIASLATALKTASEVKGDRDAVKHLTDVIGASKGKQNELIKAKAEAEKALKTKAGAEKKAGVEAKKREQEEQEAAQDGEDEDEDEDEAEDSAKKLKRLLQSLKTSKVPYYFIACDAKPYGLVVAKRNIKSSAQHKKELAQVAGGSTRPPKFGTCVREGNKLIFEMEKPAPGLARVLQKWLKVNVGIPFKVMVGTESAEDEEGPAGAAAAPPPGEAADAAASSTPAGPAPAPPQPIAPPKLGKATLAKAPEVWRGTRAILDTNIKELKKGIRAHYGTEHPEFLKALDENLVKLDVVLDKLDDRLSDSLAKAHAAKDEAARKTELKNSKIILVDYLKYVKSEPIIAHIDANPFGVKTNLKKVLTDSLTHMAQSIG